MLRDLGAAELLSVAPRPRNAAVTRAAILHAARQRFARHTYDDVGLRDIAGDAGVDASLIKRYFGSKERLFADVLRSCEMRGDLFDGQRDTFGHRIADQIVFEPKQGDKLMGLHIMLRSIGSAKASEIVQNSAQADFFGPFAAWLGGSDAAARVKLISGLMMGLAVGHELGNGFGLTQAELLVLRDYIAEMIQGLVDHPARHIAVEDQA